MYFGFVTLGQKETENPCSENKTTQQFQSRSRSLHFREDDGHSFKWITVIVFIDYIEKSHTINGVYYAILLSHLGKAMKTKHIGKMKKGVSDSS